MRWFFRICAALTAILFLSFIAWIVTGAMHADAANGIVGQIVIADLCAITAVLAYSAFVGAWHLWEELAERMDAERSEKAPDPAVGLAARDHLAAGSAASKLGLHAVKPSSAPFPSGGPPTGSA